MAKPANFETTIIHTANKERSYEIKIPKNCEAVKSILYQQIGIISFLCENELDYTGDAAQLTHELNELANTILRYENL